MKTILAALLCSTILAGAATFDIGWTPPSATNFFSGYWVYLGGNNAETRLISAGLTNRTTVTLPNGTYRLTMTSTNLYEEGDFSVPLYIVVANTNVITIKGKPDAPTAVLVK